MRILKFILLLNLLSIFNLSLFAQTYHARIPAQKISSQESQVTVPVLIDENLTGQKIYAYTLQLSWDNAQLQNPKADLAGCLAEVWGTENLLQNSPVPGQLIISHHAASPALSGTGSLIKFTFQISGNAGASASIQIDRLILNTTKALTTPGKILINNPPAALNLKINPDNPRTSNELSATYSYTDPDKDTEDSTLIQWYKNGTRQTAFNQLKKIPANSARKGERWYFSIQPHDGIEFGKKVQSAEIIIQNTPPAVQNIRILPDQPVDSDTLFAAYQFVDIDNDPEKGTEIKWYKNNQVVSTLLNAKKIPPSALKNGDSWHYTVMPKDGEAFGQSGKSLAAVIGVSNHPPEAKNLTISPANARTTDILIGTYQYADPENDPEKNSEIEWYKNNQVQTNLKNLIQVPANLTARDETWFFSVRPSDGKSFGVKINSPAIQIQNTAPVASKLEILPATPTIFDSLTANYQYQDVDQDAEKSSQLRWYKNGSLQNLYQNLKIIPSIELKMNDVWYFTIEPDDGLTIGEIVTSKKVVIQGIPSQVNFSAEPTTGTEPLNVQFQDLSQGMIKTWFWDFGDGKTSSEQNPVHIYHASDLPYSVKLVVGGPAGQDSLIKKNLINVTSAIKAYLQAVPIVGKPGLQVQFQNHTQGAALYLKWFWGDGTQKTSFADNSNIMHIYKLPGIYSVSLKANDKSYSDSTYYKDLICIQNNSIPLQVYSAGNGLNGTSWADVIDHDVFTDSGKVISTLENAWAIFKFNDGIQRKLNALRLKRANYFSMADSGRLAKKIEIYVTQEENFESSLQKVLEAELTSQEWQSINFPENVLARFVILKISAAEAAHQDTCELAEFQLFGIPDETSIDVESIPAIKQPLATQLLPNFPNPFNPETKIQYQLAEDGMISICIFNLNGKQIRTLIQEYQKSGTYQIQWDGRDDWGYFVSSGIYFCRLSFIIKKNKMVHQTQKISFVK